MPQYRSFLPGDPVPYFKQRTLGNPDYSFDTAAGRYILLCFFGSAGDAHAEAAIAAVRSRPAVFDDVQASFFGISVDPADEAMARIAESVPGYRFFLDFDGKVSRLLGSAPAEATGEAADVQLRRFWLLLDPTLRVRATVPFDAERRDIATILDLLDTLPPPDRFAGFEAPAPVLILPRVFEPELCQQLIALYEATGGTESGFVRDVGGKTVGVTDHRHKRRRDHEMVDETLKAAARERIVRRVVPEIARVHAFRATRMERYIVSCYDAAEGGHFRPHRDNTTSGTAHRRFAVSINLNDTFEGGAVCFPEYGPRGYKMPAGGAVVFSCSLLHAVSRVTAGRRYAFLPFLYDEAAARIREENNARLGAGIQAYPGAAPG